MITRRPEADPPRAPPGSSDAREAYARIRNFLAGRHLGATRGEALVEELVKCLFCRALAVQEPDPVPDEPAALAQFYRDQFTRLKARLPDVFADSAQILLDPTSLQYVDQQLRAVNLHDPLTDPIGDAYEAFIGNAARGAEGQFFTPQSAVRLLVELVDPRPGERVIDPACGAGSFLSYTARRLVRLGAARERLARDLVGIDKDGYLARLARAHLGLVTLTPPQIFCGDSLAWLAANGGPLLPADESGAFDVVLANPPFGARIVAASEEVQRRFALGHVWKRDRAGRWQPTARLQQRVPPQILFVERLLALVRPGGRVGVVLPESLVSGKSFRHVVQYMRDTAHIRAVIGMPEDLFKTSGKGGTHTKVCLILLQKQPPGDSRPPPAIFMAEAQWCGNDSRGRAIHRDELPDIARRFHEFAAGRLTAPGRLGHRIEPDRLRDNILAPRYYDPDVEATLQRLAATHDLVSIRSLLDDGSLEISTGHEVGKLAYGGGTVPFVRTSDISNWEIKRDPKHCVSDDVFAALAPKQDVRVGDILMVRDGTYLIGTCAFITEHDTRIVFQSHMYKLRLTKPDRLSPYLLLAALGSEPVQKQIQARRFTQDIIDSLGDRIAELILPLPRDPATRARIAATVEQSIRERVISRELARQACRDIAHTGGSDPPP